MRESTLNSDILSSLSTSDFYADLANMGNGFLGEAPKVISERGIFEQIAFSTTKRVAGHRGRRMQS